MASPRDFPRSPDHGPCLTRGRAPGAEYGCSKSYSAGGSRRPTPKLRGGGRPATRSPSLTRSLRGRCPALPSQPTARAASAPVYEAMFLSAVATDARWRWRRAAVAAVPAAGPRRDAVARVLFAAAVGAAAAGFRLPLTETGLGMAVTRRRPSAADAVLRLGVPTVFAFAEAALRRPRTAVDARFVVAEVARRARPRTGAAEDPALREAAFSLAFASWASSFAALASSSSFCRRSLAASFATAATCRTRIASAPALRVRGAALARALPTAELRGARRGAVAGVRRVVVRAMCRVLRCSSVSTTGGLDHILTISVSPLPTAHTPLATAVRAGEVKGVGEGRSPARRIDLLDTGLRIGHGTAPSSSVRVSGNEDDDTDDHVTGPARACPRARPCAEEARGGC
jgi:hypothetical protein